MVSDEDIQDVVEVEVFKIPPTAGAWQQHILRAHMQVLTWKQDLQIDPLFQTQHRMAGRWHNTPILTKASIVPESVIELVQCGCGVNIAPGVVHANNII